MALDDINRNNSVLPNYDLKSVVYNGMCKSDVVMTAFIKVIMNKESKNAIGFLGKFFLFHYIIMSVRLWNFKDGGPIKQDFWPNINILKVNHCILRIKGSACSSKNGHDFRK